MRFTSGRCRCSIATDGAFRGPSQRWPAPTSACGGSSRARIFDAIRKHQVTNYCGAPIVHNTMLNAPAAMREGISHTVYGMVAGAAPPVAVIEGMESIGIKLTHVYGLTETYGPATVCAKHDEWRELPARERAELNGRQGVRYLLED